MRLRIAITSVLMVGLAGCAGDGGQQASAPSPPGVTAGGDPIAMIGLWTVEGTSEEPGTVLKISPQRQLSLWRACGTLHGSWGAGEGVFVGGLSGGSQGCQPGEPDAGPDWLRLAVGYGSSGDDRVLLDRDGKVVARLLPGGKPKITEGIDASEAEPPVVTDEDRAALEGEVAPLPAGLTAVDRTSVTGRWVPATGATTPFIEFRDDGSWTGSDGCNGNGGRWATGPGGTLLATTGPSTLIGCDGAPIAAWLSSTVRAGLSAGQLVLVDAAGAEVGRLKKG